MGLVSFVIPDDDYDTGLDGLSPQSLQIGAECHIICNFSNTVIGVPFVFVGIGYLVPQQKINHKAQWFNA